MSTAGTALPFAVNERVLCYHGPLMYEAKILKTEMWDQTNTKFGSVGPHFLVHYKGWKQTYVYPYQYASPRSSFLVRSVRPCCPIAFWPFAPVMGLGLIRASFV